MDNVWAIAILVYISLAIVTAFPIFRATFRKVELNPSGASFSKSPRFSQDGQVLLDQHYSRLIGTLVFWKNQAELYKCAHFYMLYWTIPSSVLIPILAQAITADPYSKWLITVISTHTAIILALHRSLKVFENYKAFRQGESAFYDTWRRLLDRPRSFGDTEDEQIAKYFDEVENLRKFVRNAEMDNMPTLPEVKEQLKNE
jgi:hypothetical protein